MKNKIFKILVILPVILATQSCLYMSVKQDVEFDESKVAPVKFESKEAANLFSSKTKILNMKNYKGPYLKEDSLMIPFVAFKSHKTFYETQYTNSKIREADINNDGEISLKEAKALRYERAALIKRSVTLVVKEN